MKTMMQWLEEVVNDCEACREQNPDAPDAFSTTAWDYDEELCEKHQEMKDDLKKAVRYIPEAALELALWNESDDVDSAIRQVEDGYKGAWDSDGEFAENLCMEVGHITSYFPYWIEIDWDKTYDNMERSGDYWSGKGSDGKVHIFRSNY